MPKSNRKFIERTIEQARKRWSLDEQWQITWKFSDNSSRDGDSGNIEFEPVGEKRALIELDPAYETSSDLQRIRRDVFHEVGHLIVYPIWRAARDWSTKLVRSEKMRDVFEESMNSQENLVIDHVVTQIFKV